MVGSLGSVPPLPMQLLFGIVCLSFFLNMTARAFGRGIEIHFEGSFAVVDCFIETCISVFGHAMARATNA